MFDWTDAYFSSLIPLGKDYRCDVYIYGKKQKNCLIKKYPESAAPPEGMNQYFVELENGCQIHIVTPDMVLFLPWSSSKEGKEYWKEKEKKWSTPQ